MIDETAVRSLEAHSIKSSFEVSDSDRERLSAFAQRMHREQPEMVNAACEKEGVTVSNNSTDSEIAAVERQVVLRIRAVITMESARVLNIAMSTQEIIDFIYDYSGDYEGILDAVIDFAINRARESKLNSLE